ncbi:MAG: FAD-binding oxidoreductase [Gaiellaceae bacterium]
MTHDTIASVTPRLDNLRAGYRGDELAPGNGGDDESRALWNGVVDRRPAVLARVAGVEDVVASVGFAREHGLQVTARGGGHGVAGNALTDGGLVVDFSLMTSVEVDPQARTARADAGVTLGELDRATQEHGLAAPLGVVSKTGIAGLTLSGGIGWLRRKHGLAADNLVSLEVVIADGTRVTANATQNADLFWALRGGGGSFGLVTSFEYRLHPLGPEVYVAFVLYPGERTIDVLRAAEAYMLSAPDEVAPLAFMGRVPHAEPFPAEAHGEPYVAVAAVYAGDAGSGERALAPLRALGDPIVDLSSLMPYIEAQSLLDEDYPDGWRYYWKSANLDELGDGVLDSLARSADAAPSHHSTIDLWFHGGALDRLDPSATAFGARPAYLVGVEANWEPGQPDDENIAWARQAIADLEPFSSGGGYLNFPGNFEGGETLLRASYGARNFERLQALKNELDPDNLFAPFGGIRFTHQG